MTVMITDPQHGYQRQITQGDWDNAMTLVASLQQQLTDIKNAAAQAKALAEKPVPVADQAAASSADTSHPATTSPASSSSASSSRSSASH